ncbi:exopolysaccharide biosynthesis polyprenyl glycosylphosphotransferase [Wenyingzhuangia heitensis]|uniref:Exopolysaccharide biosynthesis polyprenyl glycosylphosphotransferase n=1 Tax=Wenyingzhuangia heitensis TaxID=1487859 RepID=A0ABX0U9E2_9FLAO|nr:exopolysaccharide biosynthesis polyprenyl glycosylphosphotransferase [Wenyingzhuangia heitensis]NIJ45448.1 exopolysaccharide biosynthesis polyprenyl glycosylphosphotransferase [Wenyingzhuangia heitensis]
MALKTKLYLSERIVLLRIIDVLFIGLGLMFSNLFFNLKYLNVVQAPISTNTGVLIAYYLVWAQVFQLFNLRDSASRFQTVRNLFITTCVCVLQYLYTPILTPVLPANRIEILIFFVTIFISVFIWRNIYIFTISKKQFYKHILFVSGEKEVLSDMYLNAGLYARDNAVVGYISENETLENQVFLDVNRTDINKVIEENDVKEIVISLKGFSKDSIEALNQKLVRVFEQGINIVNYEDYIEKITQCVPENNLTEYFYKYFNFSENHENRLYLAVLRLLDIFAGIGGLLFLVLFLPLIILGNLIGNRGALFYKQERVGRKGKNFNIIKLRSMVTNAEKNGAQWAVQNDSRITKFGKFLRKTRLDEIPQFWNILNGEMSLIGPRPERPEFVKELEKEIPLYGIRNVVKPGLTGWAQVMFPYAATIEEQQKKLRYDLYYIKYRNLYLDFKIVIKTINTVLYFKGQ